MSEVKPKFAPAVQAIWDNCGTYVDSISPESSAGEIEFFVDKLLEEISSALLWDSQESPRNALVRKGYINE